ncbi:ferredoxin [Kitasatospora purpeofusca]|uniref:ferredoxin n=1 Tax=Kitasatospora purpeofusca TaxID=67352 RepID=UPI0036D371D5
MDELGRWSRLKRAFGVVPFSYDAHERALRRCAAEMRARLLRHPVEGEWQDLAYWDPLPDAWRMASGSGNGRWEQRSWLNVPGPFYAGETDTGLNGPYYLPEHILSSDEDYEFVHRQPANPREVAALLEIADGEPQGGYACDGDEHWTPEAVRAWWARRDEVRAWIAAELQADRNDPEPLRQYAAHLDGGGLEAYLRGYLFWLTEHREPRLGEPLPQL